MKPRFLPSSLFMALGKRRATKLLRNDIFENYPEQAQRLKGITDGAGIDMPTALFLQLLEFLALKPSYALAACTSVGVQPERTITKETIVGKNFDFPEEFAFTYLTCETKAKNRYRTLGCSVAAYPGMIDGINEHGLSVTYNFAYTTEEFSNFVPLSIVLQEMLETCKDADEAIDFLVNAKRGGHDALLMLADEKGNLKAVEITSNHAAVREAKDGQLVNTNHYHTTEMQKDELPHNAVYSGKVPEVLLGVRIHESSEQRLKRAQELLEDKAKMDESKVASILSDHGENNKPTMLTICRHSEYRNLASTTRSVILHPNRKTIKVAYGKPCQNKYDQLKFT